MTLQFSVEVRNDMLDAFETRTGSSGRLKFYTGAQPANTALAASGTLLADITMPADWMSAAAGGSKAKLGTWSDAVADGSGTFGYFRFYASDNVTCTAQGSVGIAGSGADLIVDAATVTAGQTFTVVTFSLTGGNS